MKKYLTLVIALIPTSIVFAQATTLQSLITALGGIVTSLTKVMGGLALLVFFWGLVKYIFAQGSENTKVEAKRVMLWGLVALFVMVSVWGIIQFFQISLLGSTTFSSPQVPSL